MTERWLRDGFVLLLILVVVVVIGFWCIFHPKGSMLRLVGVNLLAFTVGLGFAGIVGGSTEKRVIIIANTVTASCTGALIGNFVAYLTS